MFVKSFAYTLVPVRDNSSNRSTESASATMSVSARTVAERGDRSSNAISPKVIPGVQVVTRYDKPLGKFRQMLAFP